MPGGRNGPRTKASSLLLIKRFRKDQNDLAFQPGPELPPALQSLPVRTKKFPSSEFGFKFASTQDINNSSLVKTEK